MEILRLARSSCVLATVLPCPRGPVPRLVALEPYIRARPARSTSKHEIATRWAVADPSSLSYRCTGRCLDGNRTGDDTKEWRCYRRFAVQLTLGFREDAPSAVWRWSWADGAEHPSLQPAVGVPESRFGAPAQSGAPFWLGLASHRGRSEGAGSTGAPVPRAVYLRLNPRIPRRSPPPRSHTPASRSVASLNITYAVPLTCTDVGRRRLPWPVASYTESSCIHLSAARA